MTPIAGEFSLPTAKPPRITIIIPTRNRLALLTRALTAIAQQTFGDFEVLVIDDGSSAEVRAGYRALWPTLDGRYVLDLVGSDDGAPIGPSVTRNLAIARARGTVLAFCDDDDLWTEHEHLAMMARAFEERPNLDIYIAEQVAVRPDGSIDKPCWLPRLREQTAGRLQGSPGLCQVSRADLVQADGFAQLNIFSLRTELARSIGGFWTRTTYEEDRDLYWRAVDAAREIVYSPHIVAQHNVPDRAKQVNLSSSFSQTERWSISVLVSQHIAMHAKDPAIRALVQRYEGDIFRHLTAYLCKAGQYELGALYARRALASRLSLKWALYTVWLMCTAPVRSAR